ncbi:MAG: ribokinase [Microbacterium sp.]|uniref:ribokinase n=1 Tax=Microbacterium sp. TaxID=51671 RepID=UPI003F7F2A86
MGSANLDLVYCVARIPSPGETVLSRGAHSAAGGKGNNQAVSAARAGAAVRFIVALGSDAGGDRISAEARGSGVTVLDRRVEAPTGTALITVDDGGENTIVVESGANARLVDLSGDERAAIAEADVLMLQLETPLETVAEAARTARQNDTVVLLNAAPIRGLPADLLEDVDILVLNEHEARTLVGRSGSEHDLARALATEGRSVVVTLGGRGALVAEPDAEPVAVPAHSVPVVDTTGAGDTFCGALAAHLDRHRHEGLVAAARFASAAAALSVQRRGAVPSIPTLEEIDAFVADS